MLCEHLLEAEAHLRGLGAVETYRGQPWTDNCREWVYVDRVVDLAALRDAVGLADCVELHQNLDPRSGTEQGLFCTIHLDGLMGPLPA